MAAGFMGSPDAVFEVRAYQDALPHCAFAGVAAASISPAAVVAVVAAVVVGCVEVQVDVDIDALVVAVSAFVSGLGPRRGGKAEREEHR